MNSERAGRLSRFVVALLLCAVALPAAPANPAIVATVIDSAGLTIPGARVQLKSAGAVVAQADAGEDGRVEFADLKPGSIR